MGLNDFDSKYDALGPEKTADDVNSISIFSGGKIYLLHSFLYSYLTGIGAFDTSAYND
jgi:hypothetical protein